jgi:hypothetical protein
VSYPFLLFSSLPIYDNHRTQGHNNKVFFANRIGAAALFPFDRALCKTWFDILLKRQGMDLVDDFLVIQTEGFVKALLLIRNVRVKNFDFHRTDMRYVKGAICAARTYYQCTPELEAKGVRRCPVG